MRLNKETDEYDIFCKRITKNKLFKIVREILNNNYEFIYKIKSIHQITILLFNLEFLNMVEIMKIFKNYFSLYEICKQLSLGFESRYIFKLLINTVKNSILSQIL